MSRISKSARSSNSQTKRDDLADISTRRLHRQLLFSYNHVDSPSEVVECFGAVQAQNYSDAKWSLVLRMRAGTETTIERAFNEGKILRTHVMRPTWHFVHPNDIRWLVELTSSRVNLANAFMYRRAGLDADHFSHSNKIIAKALDGKQYLTRGELAQALEERGVETKGFRLVYLIMRAELEALICSGPRRGKQFTYALFDDRVSHSESLDRSQALSRLLQRYFAGHGPASLHDFVWWSGLTMSDAKSALEDSRSELSYEVRDGETYWFPDLHPRHGVKASNEVLLLPTYDEFLVGYSSSGRLRMEGYENWKRMPFSSPLVFHNKIVGSWKREFGNGVVNVELAPFLTLNNNELEILIAAVNRYGEFLEKPVTCSFSSTRS